MSELLDRVRLWLALRIGGYALRLEQMDYFHDGYEFGLQDGFRISDMEQARRNGYSKLPERNYNDPFYYAPEKESA